MITLPTNVENQVSKNYSAIIIGNTNKSTPRRIASIVLMALSFIAVTFLLLAVYTKRKIRLHYENYRNLSNSTTHVKAHSILADTSEGSQDSTIGTFTIAPPERPLIPAIISPHNKREKRDLHVTFQ